MKFYKTLMIAGLVVAIAGLLVLVFQATLYFVFGEWYGFTILDIIVRIGLRDQIYTGVEGFDDAVDWLLDFSMPAISMMAGCVIGFLAYRLWQREKEWYRAG